MKEITAKMLEKLGAKPYQVKKFRELFGESGNMTLENCLKAADGKLGIATLLGNALLSEPTLAVYRQAKARALAVCQQATARAYETYRHAKTRAEEVCWRAEARAFYKTWKEMK